MANLKSKSSNFPSRPGVYQFLSKDGAVLYVGKAKNLKARISQYFQNHDTRPQIPYLMAEAANVTYTVVSSELESAYLENTLIKQYSPKYNIDLKDGKNYAFITIDYSLEIPQIGYARKIDDGRRHSEGVPARTTVQSGGHPTEESQAKGSFTPRMHSGFRMTPKIKYFGPYSAAYKIKNTLNLVRKIFPYCAAQKVGVRPCFYYYMHRCPGVCIGKITLDEYQATLGKIIKFLRGETTEIVRDIQSEMKTAAKNKKFEAAARLRDQLRALQILQEKQNVILPKKVDWDLVSLTSSDGFTCVNLFKIREGKMFDKENFVYELPTTELPARLNDFSRSGGQKESTTDAYRLPILQRFLEQYYLETSSAPKIIYTQIQPEDKELIKHVIKSRFHRTVEITIPQKGKLSKLINLGKLNAEEYLKNWLNDKAGNLDKINAALAQLKQVLKLKNIPKRIECYDISNTQGTNPVGSMVVFENGLPAKSQYRKFKIQGKNTPDDFAMMKEMLQRRLQRIKNHELGIREKDKWPTPDLIVIDGGKGQLGVATSIIHNSKFIIPVIGLAKRIEEIFLPGKAQPVILGHNQPALQLLQRLRDEAHRFGITFHRDLRSKQAVKSALDDIPGIGPKTKKLLKAKFGTVAQIKKIPLDELSKIVGSKLAQTIKKYL
jgi:excinuclease ABC subunit C